MPIEPLTQQQSWVRGRKAFLPSPATKIVFPVGFAGQGALYKNPTILLDGAKPLSNKSNNEFDKLIIRQTRSLLFFFQDQIYLMILK
jgi:hypothetical protein